ncbi:MAG TPA: sialidase family protein, partial [Candidatus Nitrosotalea sp.]|nr:sialidase family protein [Candidatus Nitrosotalea sp.]
MIPFRLFLIAALGVAAGCQPLTSVLQSGPATNNAGDSAQSSDQTCNHAPCVLPNSQASGGSRPANETPLAVDPKNPQHILVGANDWNCPHEKKKYNAYGLGYYASSDGGVTWNRTCITNTRDSFKGDNDPVVAYDLHGTAYRGGFDSIKDGNLGGGIIVSHSADGGITWSPPVIAITRYFTGGFVGHDWMTADTNASSPYENTVYATAVQFTYKGSLPDKTTSTVSASTDGGATWTMVRSGSVQRYPKLDIPTDMAVASDGTVYLVRMRCLSTGPPKWCGGSTEE